MTFRAPEIPSYDRPQSICTIYSLVIATLDRDEELRRCLASLLDPTMHDCEVIVVDQNGDDRVEQIISNFQGQLRLRHLRASYRNASRARNEGAEAAVGEWVAFPDDDCCFMTETLSNVRGLIQRKSFDLLSGRTINEGGAGTILPWPNSERPITTRSLSRSFTESAFFVRRDLFLKVKGFDPGLGPGSPYPSSEGIDFFLRLQRQTPELRALFSPSVCFYHPEKIPPYNRQAAQRLRLYGRGTGAVAARYWRTMPFRFIILPLAKSVVAMTIYGNERRLCKWEWIKGCFEGFISCLRSTEPLSSGQE